MHCMCYKIPQRPRHVHIEVVKMSTCQDDLQCQPATINLIRVPQNAEDVSEEKLLRAIGYDDGQFACDTS